MEKRIVIQLNDGKEIVAELCDYDGNHPDWVGRKVAFLPGYGTMLFIEGVTFEIDNSNVLS